MKKLLVLFFVAAMCIPSYGSILVYKTTATATVFDLTGHTMVKETENGYLVLEVDLFTQTVSAAQLVTYWGATPATKQQQTKVVTVVFYRDVAGYIVADYSNGATDAILFGKTTLTNIGLADKKYVAGSLSGSTLAFPNDSNELASGTMKATLDTVKTKAYVSSNITDTVHYIVHTVLIKYTAITDVTAPTPNPMEWAAGGEPNANGSDSSITMTAAFAIDTGSPPVEYLFTCVNDNTLSSAWQPSATFLRTGLTALTTYTFNVKARDSAPVRMVTAESNDANATTTAEPNATCPDPNPMAWAPDGEPNAISDTAITMTAADACDPQGVEYYFRNVTVGGDHNSGWQPSTTYTDTNLTPDTNYFYTVMARDKALTPNATAESTEANAVTFADTTCPDPNPATWVTPPEANGATAIYMVATTAHDADVVQYYFDCVIGGGAGGTDSGWQASPIYQDIGLTSDTEYGYRVYAKDASGNTTNPSSIETATTAMTIQQRIAAAVAAHPGEAVTVTIPAGTYNEDLDITDPCVTLVSASGAAHTTIELIDNVGISIEGTGDYFTVDGFTIEPNTAGGTTRAIELINGPTNVTIANNIIDVNKTAASMAISVGAAGALDLTIIGNNITIGSGDGGVWGADVVDVSVLNNTISGPTAHITSGYGVQFAGINGTSVINGNTLTNCGSGIFIQPAGAAGGTIIAHDVTISNNTVSHCQKGIRLGYTTLTADMNDIYVHGNTVQDNVVGLYVDSNSTHITGSTFDVNDNKFVDNVLYGIQDVDTNDANALPATLNWWGDASGPYHATKNPSGLLGDVVSDYVNFQPYWINEAMTDPNS